MNKQILRILLILLTLFGGKETYAQQTQNIKVIGGYGSYEGMHAGIAWQFQKRNQLSIAIGTNNLVPKDESSCAVSLKNRLGFNFKKDESRNHFKWQVGGSIIYWKLEDPYYSWKIMSFIPTFERNMRINSRLNLTIGAGPSIQLVLHSERKTFEEVGWPYKIQPNAFIQLSYLL